MIWCCGPSKEEFRIICNHIGYFPLSSLERDEASLTKHIELRNLKKIIISIEHTTDYQKNTKICISSPEGVDEENLRLPQQLWAIKAFKILSQKLYPIEFQSEVMQVLSLKWDEMATRKKVRSEIFNINLLNRGRYQRLKYFVFILFTVFLLKL